MMLGVVQSCVHQLFCRLIQWSYHRPCLFFFNVSSACDTERFVAMASLILLVDDHSAWDISTSPQSFTRLSGSRVCAL
jgi:hypothetical protein